MRAAPALALRALWTGVIQHPTQISAQPRGRLSAFAGSEVSPSSAWSQEQRKKEARAPPARARGMEIRTRPGRRAGEPGARRSEGRVREGQGRPRVTGEGIPAPEQSSAPESPAGAAAQGAGGVGLGRAGAAVWEMPSCSPLTARGPPALHLPAPIPPSRYMGSTWPGRRSVACGLAPPPPCCRDSGQGRPSLHKADPVARRPSQPGHLRGQPDRLGARDGLRGAAAAWAQDHSPRPRPLGPVPSAPAGSTVLSRNSCTSALAPGSSWGSLPPPPAPHGVRVAKQVAMDASQRRWGGECTEQVQRGNPGLGRLGGWRG